METNSAEGAAYATCGGRTLVIERLTTDDEHVMREARRWTKGARGLVVDDDAELVAADLTPYVTEALRLGATMLTYVGETQDSRVAAEMLRDLGDKTAASVESAASDTRRTVEEATAAVVKATTAAKRELNDELQRIFAGESPEVVARLQPLMDKVGTDLDARVKAASATIVEQATRQLDPADPTSPMARHQAELRKQQEEVLAVVTKSNLELARQVTDLTTAMKVQTAKADVAKVTPIKGDSYADCLHALLHGIAGGLGDEYTDTSAIAGRLPRCKKGDGVLAAGSGAARVVVEMTDSPRTEWNAYLDEAERNRDACASLGLVRTPEQNGGETFRVIGNRRMVMAYNPETDDPELLRTVVLVLRASALTASVRSGAREVATAEEKVGEAIELLSKIDAMKKTASAIQKHAEKMDTDLTKFNSGIHRLLSEALTALAGAGIPGVRDATRSDAA